MTSIFINIWLNFFITKSICPLVYDLSKVDICWYFPVLLLFIKASSYWLYMGCTNEGLLLKEMRWPNELSNRNTWHWPSIPLCASLPPYDNFIQIRLTHIQDLNSPIVWSVCWYNDRWLTEFVKLFISTMFIWCKMQTFGSQM